MWPFRKRKRQGRPAWESSAYNLHSVGSPMSGDAIAELDDGAPARSTVSVTITNWGQLGTFHAGVKGIAAVLGLFATIHPRCTHWWCNQPDQPFNLLAEVRYSPAAPGRGFLTDCITAEICAVLDVADDGSVASFSKPLHNLFIQCTTSDAVVVSLANLIEPPISGAGELAMWQVDMANAEQTLVSTHPVSDISDGPTIQGDQSMLFLLRRADGVVHYDRMYRHLMLDREVFATPPEVTSYEELAKRRAAELRNGQG